MQNVNHELEKKPKIFWIKINKFKSNTSIWTLKENETLSLIKYEEKNISSFINKVYYIIFN